MEQLTVEQHEAEIRRLEGKVVEARTEQMQHHRAAEKKRLTIPVAATPHDQVMKPNQAPSVLEFVKGLTAEGIAELKKLLKGDD